MILLKTKCQHFKNRVHARWNAILHEKIHSEFGVRVKYMFFKNAGSDTLIVSFPACAPNAARYNYVRALSSFNCDKLFLLDDFGTNHQGCYLVEDRVECCVKSLILNKLNVCVGGYARVIFIGSSKGGYSALNFSFLIPGVLCIIGSPQYFLGTYLDKENTKENLKFLIGEITAENKEKLNNRLKQRVLTSSIHPQCVYFHYSNKEPTYMKHVRYMLDDLKSVRIRVVHDVKYYSSHDELSLYYPPFLIETIKKIINESPSNLQ